MRDLTILADDLTGALDAAAAFAAPEQPVTVTWTASSDSRVAIDSETRGLRPAEAIVQLKALLPALGDSRIAFKKVDSLLRGNSFVEIAACWTSGLFDTVYVVPAFPAQGRLARNGILTVSGEAGPSVIDGLAAAGVEAAIAGTSPPNHGVVVYDADSDADLRAIVRSARSDARILWCGSAGLAYAMAGQPHMPATASPSLAIIGSRHPVSRAHAVDLAASLGLACVSIVDRAGVGTAIAAVDVALRTADRAALVFALPEVSAEEAERIYRTAFAQLVTRIAVPASVAIVGGDTLFRMVQTLDVQSLSVLGAHAQGVPVSRVVSGAWDGAAIVSKSGAFGDAGLFSNFTHKELQSA